MLDAFRCTENDIDFMSFRLTRAAAATSATCVPSVSLSTSPPLARRRCDISIHGGRMRPTSFCAIFRRSRSIAISMRRATLGGPTLSRLSRLLIWRARAVRYFCVTASAVSVKLHLRDKRTDGQRDASLCPLCLSGASILWGGNEPRCFIEILKGIQIQINTRNLVS